MAQPPASPPAHPTIADFQLTQQAAPNPRPLKELSHLLKPFIARAQITAHKWTSWEIKDGKSTTSPHPIEFHYSLSPPLQALIVHNAVLLNDATGGRYTAMRAYQIIIDSWRAAGSIGPRFLAFTSVIEMVSVMAMRDEVDAQIARGIVSEEAFESGEAVVFGEASLNWELNTWVGCCYRVARALCTGTVRVEVRRGWIRNDKVRDRLDLIVELVATPAKGVCYEVGCVAGLKRKYAEMMGKVEDEPEVGEDVVMVDA